VGRLRLEAIFSLFNKHFFSLDRPIFSVFSEGLVEPFEAHAIDPPPRSSSDIIHALEILTGKGPRQHSADTPHLDR